MRDPKSIHFGIHFCFEQNNSRDKVVAKRQQKASTPENQARQY